MQGSANGMHGGAKRGQGMISSVTQTVPDLRLARKSLALKIDKGLKVDIVGK